MPHLAIASSRSPSAILTVGAGQSGKTPGMGGRLPVRSREARNSDRIASCVLVML